MKKKLFLVGALVALVLFGAGFLYSIVSCENIAGCTGGGVCRVVESVDGCTMYCYEGGTANCAPLAI